MEILRAVVFFGGLGLAAWTVVSAMRGFVLPRGANDVLPRLVFVALRALFHIVVRRARSFERRDRILAMYAPIALLLLLPVWLLLVSLGFAAMYWALGVGQGWWFAAFNLSGSSLLTLGFAPPDAPLVTILALAEAVIGLVLVAMLIAYLPTIYAAFSRREVAVTGLEVRAGSPPSAVELLKRYNRLHGLERLGDVWRTWEAWFADIEESHVSLAALVFFRSPRPDRSWVTAAGAVLDAAALAASTVAVPRDVQADICIRAGYLALRQIADYFRIPHNSHPKPDDPIAITRAEYDAACQELLDAGVPLRADRDQTWRDFAGWRVNYDTVLIALAQLVMAPYAPWSSDRTIEHDGPWYTRLSPAHRTVRLG